MFKFIKPNTNVLFIYFKKMIDALNCLKPIISLGYFQPTH